MPDTATRSDRLKAAYDKLQQTVAEIVSGDRLEADALQPVLDRSQRAAISDGETVTLRRLSEQRSTGREPLPTRASLQHKCRHARRWIEPRSPCD
jgi:hypothetical protein